MAAGRPTVPPRLTGPRMAVWGYFPFDGRSVDPSGTHADWTWAMQQWDKVAQAAGAVRLVIADQTYSHLDVGSAAGEAQRSDLRTRFANCRAAEQLVFGRVYAAGGKLPLGVPGSSFDDPLNPGHQRPGVAEQVDAWRRLFGDEIDGIYVDSGPSDCTDPTIAGSVRIIAPNYASYVLAIRQQRYKVFLQAVQYPDNQPGVSWLRDLGADFLELWEAGVLSYRSRYQAKDPCRPELNTGPEDWWDPGSGFRWNRVHVITDCRDVATMQSIAQLAVDKRGAWTVWITRSRQDSGLNPAFDTLPPYWDEQIAFFRRFVDAEEQAFKDATDTAKEGKDTKDTKDTKDGKDDKDSKESKDSKDVPDDAAAKAEKDTKDGKDDKEDKDSKDTADNPPKDPKEDDLTEKQEKDLKDFKDQPDEKLIHGEEFKKDSENAAKGLESLGLSDRAESPETDEEESDDEPVGRTYITPAERPVVGERVVADPPETEQP